MRFRNPFINDYLDLVEDTESPRIYHLWCLLSGVGMCLGRRVHFPFGINPLFPNHYTLLIGNPAMRKGSAMSVISKLLKESTGIRFAAKDTAGQRQGLALAMEGKGGLDDAVNQELRKNGVTSLDAMSINEIGNIELDFRADNRDRNVMSVTAGEFTTFLGTNNASLLDFLNQVWDGEAYDYETKSGKITIPAPLLSVVGCTTPTSLARALPPEAGAQGFLSRVILVYGAKKYKKVPRPSTPPAALVTKIEDHFKQLFYDFEGEMEETKDGREYSIQIYDKELEIADARFVYYGERRYTHFLKLAMVLAAARFSKIITLEDFQEAEAILSATERFMPDALGEFGMSKVAAAKQQILEFLRACEEPITTATLRAVMHRDLKVQELMMCLADLEAAGQIIRTESDRGVVWLPVQKIIDEEANATAEVINLMKLIKGEGGG